MSNRLFIGASLSIRMGISLIVFVFLARGLGPQQFGLVATVISYATIASLLTDFGLSVKTLRDIANAPTDGAATLSSNLSVKALLALIVTVFGAFVILLLPIDGASKVVAALLGAAILVGSFGDLSLVAFRALGRYSDETWIILWTSVSYLVIVSPLVFLNYNIQWVAVAIFASRMLYGTAAFIGAIRLFPGKRIQLRPLNGTLVTMRNAQSWALDNGLTYLNGQLDTLVVVAIFGLNSAGLYQSGARFVQAALSLGTIFSSIHIPAVAAYGVVGKMSGAEKRMMIEFASVGFLLGAIFWLGGPYVTQYLLGPHYYPVNALWPGFGVFLFVRYLASSLGSGLIAYSAPRIRVVGQVMTIGSLALGFNFLSKYGIVAMPWIMSIGASVTVIFYLIGRIWLAHRALKIDVSSVQ